MCGVIQSHHHSYDRLEHLGHQSAKSGFLVVKAVRETVGLILSTAVIS